MGRGGTLTRRVDIIDIYDPRVTGRAAPKGTLFRYIPGVGNPVLLIKVDDGFTTNWISASGGGGGGTGDPETLAYFNTGTGALTDNLNARFFPSTNSMALLVTPGTVTATGNAAVIFAEGDTTETVTASVAGAFVHGAFLSSGGANAGAIGSTIAGLADGGFFVTSTGAGSVARGDAKSGGYIFSDAAGAVASGAVLNVGQINSVSPGSYAAGAANNNGIINAGNAGVFGAMAFGGTNNNALISALETGSLAHGGNNGAGSKIRATAGGAHAHGVSGNGGQLEANGIGSHASGFANTHSLTAGGLGSAVFGTCDLGNHTVGGQSAISVGDFNSQNGDFAACFGIGHTVSSYAALVVGRYGITTGATNNAWVNTDPAFAVGNGTGVGTEALGFVVSKDGQLKTTAAQVHAACRSVNADTTLSARTDRTLFVDTATATGNVTVTFPAGEQGLEYFVKDSGNNATVNNIIFAASGGDTIEASADVTNSRGTRHFQYFGGVWYVMNLP